MVDASPGSSEAVWRQFPDLCLLDLISLVVVLHVFLSISPHPPSFLDRRDCIILIYIDCIIIVFACCKTDIESFNGRMERGAHQERDAKFQDNNLSMFFVLIKF